MSKRLFNTHANRKKLPLTLDTMNQNALQCEYAVRGRVLQRSMELEKELKKTPSKFPFTAITPCNIGNPHALNQPALTFHRQVLSGCLNPSLLKSRIFPSDVNSRVEKYLAGLEGGMGAYSNSQGILQIREDIAAFIESRDKQPSDPSLIYLTNGASEAVKLMMTLLLSHDSSECNGILTPLPQYPLYSATLSLLGGRLVPYYLDEEKEWSVDVNELKRALKGARSDGTVVKGICVLNPGNPTGNILTRTNIEEILELAVQEGLLVFADEVYQENIWRKNRPFISFKKVATEMGLLETPDLQLVSFHSISKGFMGECGIRGGYFEVSGFNQELRDQIYKMCSISLCSNTPGQIMTGLMINPPKQGEPSYNLYETEKENILRSLKEKSKLLHSSLNKMKNVTCNEVEGALYAFPRVELPDIAILRAKAIGIAADEFYCLEMLERSGVVMVPGSGFGQVPGTYHFRLTFLPEAEKMPGVLKLLQKANDQFMEEFSN